MKAYYLFDHLTFVETPARQALEEILGDEKLGKAWFITADGITAGYVILAYGTCVEFHGKTAVIDELFLNEGFRGQGVGPKILLLLEEFCRTQGVKVMRLEVEHSNERAKKVYEKAGFQIHERHLMSRVL